jgi:predicted component of type VI protein secretion system
VQPVEIASAMRGAMDDRAAVLGPGRTMVPNVFTIELAETDYERLSSYSTALTDELVAAAEDHADAQRYVTPGPFEVRLVSGDDLETGIFRVRPAAKDGRARPSRPSPASSSDHAHPAEHDLAAYRPQPRPTPERRPEPRPQTPATREVPSSRPARGRGPRPVLEIDGRPVPLTAAVTVLGRDGSADLVVDDPGVSRRHAEVRISHDGPHLQVLLRDLGSTNGTYLNGEQIGDEELHDGDRVTMGRSTLIFRLEG